MKTTSEKNLRSIAKSITFRIAVIFSDSVTSLVITKSVQESIMVVVFTNISSTILYYLHERLWNRINWLRNTGEHLARSLVKSLTFRIAVIASDFLITSVITGNALQAVNLIIFTNLFSTILYFIHERIWNNIEWGKLILP